MGWKSKSNANHTFRPSLINPKKINDEKINTFFIPINEKENIQSVKVVKGKSKKKGLSIKDINQNHNDVDINTKSQVIKGAPNVQQKKTRAQSRIQQKIPNIHECPQQGAPIESFTLNIGKRKRGLDESLCDLKNEIKRQTSNRIRPKLLECDDLLTTKDVESLITVENDVVSKIPAETHKNETQLLGANDIFLLYANEFLAEQTVTGDFFSLWWAILYCNKIKNLDNNRASWEAIFKNLYEMCTIITKFDNYMQPISKISNNKKKMVRFCSFDIISNINFNYSEREKQTNLSLMKLIEQFDKLVQCQSDLLVKLQQIDSEEIREYLLKYTNHKIFSEAVLNTSLSGRMKSVYNNWEDIRKYDIISCAAYILPSMEGFFKSSSTCTLQTYMSNFSCILASLIRHQLRKLCIQVSLEDISVSGDNIWGHILTTYIPYDLAVLHCALADLSRFRGLVQQLDMSTNNLMDDLSTLETHHIDNLKRYFLSHTLLQHYITAIVEERSTNSKVANICRILEDLCCKAKQLNFEDESYIFPLANLTEFKLKLTARSTFINKLRNAVEAYEKKNKKFCGECKRELFNEELQSHNKTVTCRNCKHTFHLICLNLPMNFAAYSDVEVFSCSKCFFNQN